MKKIVVTLIALLTLMSSVSYIFAEETNERQSDNGIAYIEENYANPNGVSVANGNAPTLYSDTKYKNQEPLRIMSKTLSITKYYQDNYSDIMYEDGDTIAQSGCLVTSLTMAQNFLKGQNKNPSQINASLGNDACPLKWYYAATDLGLTVELLQNTSSTSYVYDEAINYILQDIPLIVGFKKWSSYANDYTYHYVLAKGFNIYGSSTTIYINDPLYSNNYTTLSSYINAGWSVCQIAAYSY